MKKTRILALLTAAALFVSVLSGCLATFYEIEIGAEGNGTVTAKVGSTKEALEALNSLSDEPSELPEDTFEQDGVTYYGSTTSVDFDDLATLENLLNETPDEGESATQTFTFDRNEAGQVAFTLLAGEQDTSDTDGLDLLPEEQAKAIADSMKSVITLTFPAEVRQVSGTEAGITLNGSTLVIDAMALTPGETYRFTTDPEGKFVVEPKTVTTPLRFSDLDPEAPYVKAVLWASDYEITTGTSATTFSPDMSCDRAQVVTFLYRASGSPEVEDSELEFTDVPENAWYRDAVLWAVEYGITTGTSATTFSPNVVCSPVEVITFLYRATGREDLSDGTEKWYTNAVKWAERNGLLKDTVVPFTTDTSVACPRADIVTYLYRVLGETVPMEGKSMSYDDAEYEIQVAMQFLLEEAYGDKIFDARVYVQKIYTAAEEQQDEALKSLNLGPDEYAFEVMYELLPAEGVDPMQFTAATGDYNEETGWVTDKYNVGILRPSGLDFPEYEITNFGTGF